MDASPAEAAVAAPVNPAVTGETAEFDPLRDGPLRYLGYANEVRTTPSAVKTSCCCTFLLLGRVRNDCMDASR
jgi:hypothetical protein